VENKDEGREGKDRKFNCLFGRLLSKKTAMLGVSRLFSVPFNRPHPSNHLLLQPPSISLLNNGETLYYVPVSAAEILRTQEWLKIKKIIFVISQSK